MENKERKAQEALGLSKSYKVTMAVPTTSTGSYEIEVNAVSLEDAKEQALKILRIKTKKQIIIDCNTATDRPIPSNGGFGFRDHKLNGTIDDIRLKVREYKEFTTRSGMAEVDVESNG